MGINKCFYFLAINNGWVDIPSKGIFLRKQRKAGMASNAEMG